MRISHMPLISAVGGARATSVQGARRTVAVERETREPGRVRSLEELPRALPKLVHLRSCPRQLSRPDAVAVVHPTFVHGRSNTWAALGTQAEAPPCRQRTLLRAITAARDTRPCSAGAPGLPGRHARARPRWPRHPRRRTSGGGTRCRPPPRARRAACTCRMPGGLSRRAASTRRAPPALQLGPARPAASSKQGVMRAKHRAGRQRRTERDRGGTRIGCGVSLPYLSEAIAQVARCRKYCRQHAGPSPAGRAQRSGRSSGAGWRRHRRPPARRGGGAGSRPGRPPTAAAPRRPPPRRSAACPARGPGG